MTAKIETMIRMEARGEPHDAVLKACFGLEPDCEPRLRHNAEARMCDWRKRPDFKAIWDDELSARVRRRVPAAIGRLDKQVDNENDWVANKASNDVIALAKAMGIIRSEADNATIKVQIEGLPELGSPDQEE
jgi:hypothetical protein